MSAYACMLWPYVIGGAMTTFKRGVCGSRSELCTPHYGSGIMRFADELNSRSASGRYSTIPASTSR